MLRRWISLAVLLLAASSVHAQGVAKGQGSATGSGTIVVAPPAVPPTVTIVPTSLTLQVSTSHQFTATVTNDNLQQGVTWTLTGAGCSGNTCGTLNPATTKSGVPTNYTAPASAPTPNTVTITATSITNPAPTSSASATITITTPQPPITIGNVCRPTFQTPAATNTFNCPPSNGSFMAVAIAVATSDTPTQVQVAPSTSGPFFTLIKACDPSNICLGSTSPGGATYIWYGIGVPLGETTIIVTNSPAAGGVIDIGVVDAQNVQSFATASQCSATSGTAGACGANGNVATVNPVGAGITVAQANELVISDLSTTGVTSALAGPFTFAPMNSGDGLGYFVTNTTNPAQPSWTTTSGTWSAFTAGFLGGTTTPTVSVSISPTTASVLTNTTFQFTPQVTNGTQGVNWSLSGGGCSGATCGTLSSSSTASGVPVTYTAPNAVPSPATVTLTATSIDDPTKTATATITVTSNPIVVTVSPGSANVVTSATQTFSCTVTNDPSTAGCDWTLTGAGCSGATCGTLSTAHTASGVNLTYTGPGSVPSPAMVTLTSASTTDNTKTAAATITVVAAPVLTVTVAPGTANVVVDATQNFTPTVTNDGSNLGVDWTLSGTACPSNCGSVSPAHTASGVATVYTAPTKVPASPGVTITATSTTDNTKSASSTITVVKPANLTVAIAPTSASVTTNATKGFTATVTNDPSNLGVTWALSCTGTCGTLSTSSSLSGVPITYTAPASVPGSTVTLTATSVTAPSVSTTATITVTSAVITVTISPAGPVNIQASGTQAFTATVANSALSVNWTLACNPAPCGSLSVTSGANTTYTAPATTTPLTVTLTATSIQDGTKSASVTINVTPVVGPQNCVGKPCPAFFGAGGNAEGPGASTPGGRGGLVYNITCLSDAVGGCGGPTPCNGATCGTGQTPTTGFINASMRDCINASGSRYCLPQISGMWTPLSEPRFNNANITIAGQTAPGGPFTIGGPGQIGQLTGTFTNNIVVRYITYDGFKPGATGPDTGTVGMEPQAPSNTIIFDHVSCRWAGNKCWIPFANGSVGQNVTNISFAYSMLYEPNIQHPVGPMHDADYSNGDQINLFITHSLFQNIGHRIPLNNVQQGTFQDNIIYNWGVQWQNVSTPTNPSDPSKCASPPCASLAQYGWAVEPAGSNHMDIINNLFRWGPEGLNLSNPHPINVNPNQSADCTTNCNMGSGAPLVFISGNVCDNPLSIGGGLATGNDLACSAEVNTEGGPETANPVRNAWLRNTPNPAPQFPVKADAATSLPTVLSATVGNSQHLDPVNCTGAFVGNRDSQDQRIISQLNNLSGGAPFGSSDSTSINYSKDYNGAQSTPPITTGTPCTQSLHDGIPDAWKTLYHLSTSDVTLYKTTDPATGLTYLEDYLDGLTPNAGGTTGAFFNEPFNGTTTNNIWFTNPCAAGITCGPSPTAIPFAPIFTFVSDGGGAQALQLFDCSSTDANNLCQISDSNFGQLNAVATNCGVHAGYIAGTGSSPRPNCINNQPNSVDDGNGTHEETWYRYHIRLPSGYLASPGDQNELIEFHVDSKTEADAKATGGVTAYSTALEIKADNTAVCTGTLPFCTAGGTNPRFYLQVPGGATSCGASCRVIAYEGASNSLLTNHWYDIVLHMVWDSSPTVGLAELWIDGTQVLSNHMATHYLRSDGTQSYGEEVNLGNYRHWANFSSSTQFENLIWGPSRQSIGF